MGPIRRNARYPCRARKLGRVQGTYLWERLGLSELGAAAGEGTIGARRCRSRSTKDQPKSKSGGAGQPRLDADGTRT